jgi:peptide-methionine (R)-S-oxide reductase
MSDKVTKSDEEWREELTPEQYWVTRKGGTEAAFSGEYHDLKDAGLYHCVCCGSMLFSSKKKYDSKTGWPSFWAQLTEGSVATREDQSGEVMTTEVLCGTCDAHLGHLFHDGPPPTGLRFCINSVAMRFAEGEEAEEEESGC